MPFPLMIEGELDFRAHTKWPFGQETHSLGRTTDLLRIKRIESEKLTVTRPSPPARVLLGIAITISKAIFYLTPIGDLSNDPSGRWTLIR